MTSAFEITEQVYFPQGTQITEFVLRESSTKRQIASVMTDRQGTVMQLRYPTTKSYTGPESTRAIAELMQRAASHSEGK